MRFGIVNKSVRASQGFLSLSAMEVGVRSSRDASKKDCQGFLSLSEEGVGLPSVKPPWRNLGASLECSKYPGAALVAFALALA
jgi:hypothetical protein